MKLFISADIEGVSGVTRWSETERGGDGYREACERMTREVNAACRSAVDMGYEVVVKDGHGDACNIDPDALPKGVKLIRGWMNSPAAMMGGLDESFDAAAYIGYHSPAGTDTSPLAHTIDRDKFNWMELDGMLASEFDMNRLWAAHFGVPSVLVSGDRGICDFVENRYPGIYTFATKNCTGNATESLTIEESVKGIERTAGEALTWVMQRHDDICKAMDAAGKKHSLRICFVKQSDARNASWYPGVKIIDPITVEYESEDIIDLITARMFMTGI